LSKRIENLYARLAPLKPKLEKAGYHMPFEVYVCGMLGISFIAGLVGIAMGVVIGFAVNLQPSEFKFFLPIFTGVAAFQATFGILYIKPGFAVSSRRKKFADELPYFMGYMATLASSGLTLEGIFKAIAQEQTNEEIVKSARQIVRNLDMFGMDIVSAISELISNSPSDAFSELLEGLISTVQSGGNLKEYFTATAKVQMEEKKQLMRKMASSLGIIAEMYTILLIVFPLMAIIMLAIMAIMSGDMMGMDLLTIMRLVTYLLVPMFGIMIMVMMDGMVPKR
jgi:flagellar protein FlaJ